MGKTESAFKRRAKSAQRKWRLRAFPAASERDDKRWDPNTVAWPPEDWELGLFPPLRTDGEIPLAAYLEASHAHAHVARNQLHSSWTLGANLYFPFRASESSRAILSDFWSQKIERQLLVSDVVLEFMEPVGSGRESALLLGERSAEGERRQTAPDIAFHARTPDGSHCLILLEVKYTEKSFYHCSRAKKLSDEQRQADCVEAWRSGALLDNPERLCAQMRQKQRPYLPLVAETFRTHDAETTCEQCPALRGGYQLLRQQALAKALENTGAYVQVFSAVAFDRNNSALGRSLRATGLEHSVRDWARIAQPFTGVTHREWVRFVAQRTDGPDWLADWLRYVGDRYGYS